MTERIAMTPDGEAQWLAWRAVDVTSTESAALFGLSPYATAFELWHRKHDKAVVKLDGNERMDWGNDLQDSIAMSLARRYAVRAEKFVQYMRLPSARMGSSFDFRIFDMNDAPAPDPSLQDMFRNFGPGILEIKNVDRSIFAQQWIKRVDDEEFLHGKPEIEPPGHIDIQVQHQLHVSGLKWAAIGVLVGGNTGRIVIRKYDPAVGESLERRVRAFWESVDKGDAPSPVFPGDAEFVASLYRTSTDAVFDGRGNEDLDEIIAQYGEALAREKLAKEDKVVARAKALMIIGNAERAYTDRFSISAKQVGATRVEAYDRAGYRGWKVTPKKL